MSTGDLTRISLHHSNLKRFRSQSSMFVKDPSVSMPEATYESVGCIQRNHSYIRVRTLIHHVSLELYYNIVHDERYGGFPTGKAELYKAMKEHESTLVSLQGTTISDSDWRMLFPENGKTDSQEFSVELLRTVVKYCVESFPDVRSNDSNGDDEHENYFTLLEELQDIARGSKTHEAVNSSEQAYTQMWESVVRIVAKLKYDMKSVEELEKGDIDYLPQFRFSLLNTEIAILMEECDEIGKSIAMNELAISKLVTDYRSLASRENQQQDHSTLGSEITEKANRIKEDNTLSAHLLSVLKSSIAELCTELRYWRERNIEGDVIVFEDKLCRLKNDVGEQSRQVGEIFHTTSLDIVKMKERLQNQTDNPLLLSQRSPSSHSLKSVDSNSSTS